MVLPGGVAFMATRGVEERTRQGPGRLGPFSDGTLGGPRSARATGHGLLLGGWAGKRPQRRPGAVETKKRMVEVEKLPDMVMIALLPAAVDVLMAQEVVAFRIVVVEIMGKFTMPEWMVSVLPMPEPR